MLAVTYAVHANAVLASWTIIETYACNNFQNQTREGFARNWKNRQSGRIGIVHCELFAGFEGLARRPLYRLLLHNSESRLSCTYSSRKRKTNVDREGKGITTAQLISGHISCHLVLESVHLLSLRIFFDFHPSAA